VLLGLGLPVPAEPAEPPVAPGVVVVVLLGVMEGVPVLERGFLVELLPLVSLLEVPVEELSVLGFASADRPNDSNKPKTAPPVKNFLSILVVSLVFACLTTNYGVRVK
jgi:hypothetical protein